MYKIIITLLGILITALFSFLFLLNVIRVARCEEPFFVYVLGGILWGFLAYEQIRGLMEYINHEDKNGFC